MSWLAKLLPPRIKSTPGVRKTPVPEGLWIKCPSCEAMLYRTDLEKNLLRLSEVQLPQARRRARAHRAAARRRGPLRDRPRGGADRQPQVQGHEEVSGAPRDRARGDRRDRRAGRHAGQRPQRAARARGVRVRLHGRLDGLGRRRALRARRARRLREPRCRSSACRRRVARGCRKASIRCSRWRRPPPCCRSSRRRGCRSCRSSPIRRWAACRRRSRSSPTSCSPSPAR